MYLPESVKTGIQLLEQAGFRAYAVGGCVRDWLLSGTPHDYDLCTDALPQQICQVFSSYPQVHTGIKHGTVAVGIEKDYLEITTFRTEGAYRDHRHPDWVTYVPSLEKDLARRDFTVNAMAYSPREGIVDPFGGRQDLQDHVLRAVGCPMKRFQEDALRILRGVRFAVRFSLQPEEQTRKAMFLLAPSLENIAQERIFDELCGLLPLVSAQDLLDWVPVITAVIPELAPTVDFQQHNPHHCYDVYTHIALATQAVPGDLALRFAALLHDAGKPAAFTRDERGRGHFYGHAQISAELADRIMLRLKAPTALRTEVTTLISLHMTKIEPDRKAVRRILGRIGWDMLDKLLILQQADMSAKGVQEPGDSNPPFPKIRAIMEEIRRDNLCFSLPQLAISGKDLVQAGYAPGKQMGACLNSLLRKVQEESLENTRERLLDAARDFYCQQEILS